MMLLLCVAKKTIVLDRVVREGRWQDARRYMVPMPKLTGEVLGLVAFGNIPRKVAARAKGFDGLGTRPPKLWRRRDQRRSSSRRLVAHELH